MSNKDSITSICVVGASGDLAKKKIFPALFSLYVEGSLSDKFTVYGYARTDMSNQQFKDSIVSTLTCRALPQWLDSIDCDEQIDTFLENVHYVQGQYDSAEDFADMNRLMTHEENDMIANRIFFLSVPPNLFVPVARNAIQEASSRTGYTRTIIEKPFGRDTSSSRLLSEELLNIMSEDQIYRIDHYLGKELIDNLAVLRFSNIMFQPLWSRDYIHNVQITFSEPFGTEGRGGYFDNYNIIRDIMQNHLLQIMALFAMETPLSLDAEDIRDEKVKLLKAVRTPRLGDTVLGQYKANKSLPSYTDDPSVPNDSLCPTFAAIALFIDNARWAGVPFMMKAGKALHKRSAEIRVQFRKVPAQLYKQCGLSEQHMTNELVIRIQPDEAIYLKMNNKMPGLGVRLDNSHLDLTYKTRYNKELPDAYERLLLDVMNGDKRLFIRGDELDAAWSIFTPLLHEIENEQIQPELYPYGSRGPIGTYYLGSKYGVYWGD